MSVATPSPERLPDAVRTGRELLSTAGGAVLAAVRALAFWTTIPLALVVTAMLLSGLVGSAPRLVGVLASLTVVCAVFGHDHSPGT